MSARIELHKLPERYQKQAAEQLQKKQLIQLGGIEPQIRAANIEDDVGVTSKKKRLRQSTKPLQNSNELAFEMHLRELLPNAYVHPQAVTLGLANGVRYTPDFMSYEPLNGGRLCFWEVKGPRKIFDGAGEKLKIAASKYREFIFTLVWEEHGEWQQQRIRS
jgi:hypothetical protein